MPSPSDASKYRAAIDVLQKGRDVLVEAMTDEILDQGEQFAEGGFLFQEFLETQGTRLHFLSLLVAQLEQSAEIAEESSRDAVRLARPTEPGPAVEPIDALFGPEDAPEREETNAPPKRRRGRPRTKKLQEASAEGQGQGRVDEA